MKTIYELEEELVKLLAEHLPMTPFAKARRIIHEIIICKEVENE
jgi:hypothetical protein